MIYPRIYPLSIHNGWQVPATSGNAIENTYPPTLDPFVPATIRSQRLSAAMPRRVFVSLQQPEETQHLRRYRSRMLRSGRRKDVIPANLLRDYPEIARSRAAEGVREKGASRIGVGLCRNSSPSPEEHSSHEHNRLRADRCQLKTEKRRVSAPGKGGQSRASELAKKRYPERRMLAFWPVCVK